MLNFVNDYNVGACPQILSKLTETNMLPEAGYGEDEFCLSAKARIREALAAPDADIWFLSGGTQANATVITAMLRTFEGVIAADTGHIAVHECGAIEARGHKVLPLPQTDGKLLPETLEAWLSAHFADGNRDHLVWPGMVYLSQPTELGTLYSKAELTALHAIAQRCSLPLYIDGARLSYALACPENDISLPELTELCEAFYIGGTKTGALIGEAVVFPHHGSPAHFMSTIKQCGALLAKGRLLGIQFDVLFTDGLYLKLASNAIRAAADIRAALAEAGIPLAVQSPTNQTFAILTKAQQAALEAEGVAVCWWESIDKDRDVVRFASSWATAEEDTAALREILCRISRA